jgi:cysteine peptidase B
MESDAIRLGLAGMTKNSPLSPQELVSCFAKQCTTGKAIIDALKWIADNGGMMTESAYPYTSKNSVVPTCTFSKSQAVVSIKKFPNTYNYNDDQMIRFVFNNMWSYGMSFATEEAMAQYVLTTGPVAVTVNFDSFGSTYLGGGVTALCPVKESGINDRINHAVQIVGVNIPSNGGQAYWILRNQWSTMWGINGHVWIPYGVSACGIGNQNPGATNFYTSPIATGNIPAPSPKPTTKPTSVPVMSAPRPTSKPTAKPSSLPAFNGQTQKPSPSPTGAPRIRPTKIPTKFTMPPVQRPGSVLWNIF